MLNSANSGGINMDYPNRLRELRKEKDMSGTQVAEMLNISPQYYYDLEKGKRRLNVELAQKIAEIYNVSVDYLLGNTDVRSPADEITEAVSDDPELAEFWDDLKRREDLQIFFKQTRNLSPKTIKQVMKIIKAIEDEEGGE